MLSFRKRFMRHTQNGLLERTILFSHRWTASQCLYSLVLFTGENVKISMERIPSSYWLKALRVQQNISKRFTYRRIKRNKFKTHTHTHTRVAVSIYLIHTFWIRSSLSHMQRKFVFWFWSSSYSIHEQSKFGIDNLQMYALSFAFILEYLGMKTPTWSIQCKTQYSSEKRSMLRLVKKLWTCCSPM